MPETKKGVVPRLRFPEFRDAGPWEVKRLGEVLTEHKLKSSGREEVFSVSIHKGLINQIEHLGRSFAAASTAHYNRVLPGDIVYTKSPTGDFPFGIVKQNKTGRSVIVSPLYGVFSPVNFALGVLIDAFFESPQRTKAFLEPLVQKGAKNTINIKNDRFLSGTMVLPSIEGEQQKIADCLSSLDDLIEAEEAQLTALREHKKGLLQQLFPREGETTPRLRFPEFRDAGPWEVKRLGEVCEINPACSELPDHFIYIDLESVESGRLLCKRKIKRNNAPSRAQRLLKQGDILFQTVRPYQRNNLLFAIDDRDTYVASTGYAQLRAYDSERFLFQLLHTDTFVLKVLARCTGSNYPAINSADLEFISIPFPSLPEQQKIADCLSSLDELIELQAQRLDALKAHKKGLLQQLFPQEVA